MPNYKRYCIITYNHYVASLSINHISSFNSHECWVDGVRLLDDAGGPNHVGNVCDSPLMASVTDQVRCVLLDFC